VLAAVSVGVDATAKLTFVGAASAMTPTTFKVVIGTDTELTLLVANDRLEIHLPGFGGAYNSFGARHEAAAPSGNYVPNLNGITALDADGAALAGTQFNGVEWDAHREVRTPTLYSRGPSE